MRFSGIISRVSGIVAAAALAAALATGCGGGGGGGGPANPPSPGGGETDPPAQAAWSPAKSSFLNSSSFTLSFDTGTGAVCRWGRADVSYASMSSDCSTDFATRHSCTVTGLPEGETSVYVACAGNTGNIDTAATNENIPYSIDLTGPAVTVDSPDAGAVVQLTDRAAQLPQVSASYSDTFAGIQVSTLVSSFTIADRTVAITDLFGKDPAANKNSSRTDASVSDPLARTSVAGFTEGAFDEPAGIWTVDHTGKGSTLDILDAGGGKVMVWDSAGEGVWIIDAGGGGDTVETDLDAPPASVAVSAASGRFYAVFPGDARLHEYLISDGSAAATYSLPGMPALLAHNTLTDKLYISYESRMEIGVFDCAASALAAASAAALPELLAAWPADGGRILYVADSGGAYRLFEIAEDGTAVKDVYATLQRPKGLAADAVSGFSVVSDFSWDRVVAVDMETGGTTQIDVGAAPSSIFAGSGGAAYVVNSADRTITPVDLETLSAGAAAAPDAPPVDGVCLSSTGDCYVVEDVWDIPTPVSVSISVSVADTAGNTGSDSVDITVNPPEPGG